MELNGKRTTILLYAVQGTGIVFVCVFLAAYLGGLPSTAVLHIEPAFRITLTIFGAALLVIILATVVLAIYGKISTAKIQ
jgi:uncharacterized membrane protein